ncbi:unnamed protein product [Zymoseptoria tritici ST99CH_1A5]|uniref:Uncharacterized protein n=1 Tax=Zymoseptoria tritici ST99CH_1A5 TaxID=1276529 RepID=A0A1Y6LN75_ZYMTR|nr:unnamed protein product [Zymoseptoria tritici ST99CH_3D1]SMY25862.1 unnamed protein product [Zymoseptoria tritici ST99CH_1A5]
MSDRTLVTVVLPGLADMMLVMPGTLSQTMQDADVSTFTLDAIDRVKNRGVRISSSTHTWTLHLDSATGPSFEGRDPLCEVAREHDKYFLVIAEIED